MKEWIWNIKNVKVMGQSLVEIAIFIPILIFIIAGVVEVSNLLITKNRVTTASRISAGFGSTNYDPGNWAQLVDGSCEGGTACAMGIVAINTVTETLDLSPDLWDVWSLRGKVIKNTEPYTTPFRVEPFDHTHSYGNYQVVSDSEWTQIVKSLDEEIIEDLAAGDDNPDDPNINDLAFVATIAYHDIDTILGIPIWQWTGLQTIRGMTVMRVDEPDDFGGCPLLPISIRLDQVSLYPSNWFEMGGGSTPCGSDPDPKVQLKCLFPEPDMFQMPDPKKDPELVPVYTQTVTITNPLTPTVVTNYFEENVPGIPLEDAEPGYLFWARDLNAVPPGNFGWLSWRGDTDAPTLADSLRYPGNFLDEEDGYPGSFMDENDTAKCPVPEEMTGDDDGHLEIGEWVANATGNMPANPILNSLDPYIIPGQPMILLVHEYSSAIPHPDGDWTCNDMGSNTYFKVWDFAVVELLGYNYGKDKWALFRFIRWAKECSDLGSDGP